MARQPRYDAEYFPYYVKEGKTFTVVKHRYGLMGIGFIAELFKILARTPHHFIHLSDESDELYFWSTVGIDADKGREITIEAINRRITEEELKEHQEKVLEIAAEAREAKQALLTEFVIESTETEDEDE